MLNSALTTEEARKRLKEVTEQVNTQIELLIYY